MTTAAKKQIQVGSWVSGLSHRAEGRQHGNTLYVEGAVIKENSNRPEGHPRELWVHYLAPLMIDGERRDGGWFRENELAVIEHRDPRSH